MANEKTLKSCRPGEHPPGARLFQKGKSGNPAGRPPVSRVEVILDAIVYKARRLKLKGVGKNDRHTLIAAWLSNLDDGKLADLFRATVPREEKIMGGLSLTFAQRVEQSLRLAEERTAAARRK